MGLHAVVHVGGHQFRVAPDESLLVPRLRAAVGEKVDLGEVLLVSGSEGVKVGRPTVQGARVEVEVLGHEKGPKLLVFKMKRRKSYRRKRGHRQDLTRVRVLRVMAGQ